MVTNIETLEILHGNVELVHEYYKGLLVMETLVAVAGAVNSVADLYMSGVRKTSARLATEAPFPNPWDAQVKLYGMAKALRSRFIKQLIVDGAFTVVELLPLLTVNAARRRVVRKYDPLIDQTLTNINDLSRGISEARAEMRRLARER